jgi:exopolysaccharide biosynthesis protein
VPSEALAWLQPDTVRTLPVAQGVWYRYAWSSRGPWAVHLVEADLRRCALDLQVVRSSPRERGGVGLERVTSMAARYPGPVVAAVNGDFFTPEGRPLGMEVVRGTLTHRRERPGLAWRHGLRPVVEVMRVEGGRVRTRPAGRRGGQLEVIGGFPELLDGGVRVGDLEVEARPSFAASRHPRTAVGYDADRRRLWLVVVDGRQGDISTGMTLPELTSLLERLGVDEALNLDGGGSATMVLGRRLFSRPSDDRGERPVANALVLTLDPARCRPGGRP